MGNDFVHVRLTEAGIRMADGNPLTISGRTSVKFLPGQSTRVARYEWDFMLKHTHTPGGDPMVEIVPADAGAPDVNFEPEKETH